MDTGYWMLEKGVARAARTLAPRITLFLFVKSTEYLVNPVSRIQYPSILVDHRCRVFVQHNMANLNEMAMSVWAVFNHHQFLTDIKGFVQG